MGLRSYPMKPDPQSPASKQDIALLMEELGRIDDHIGESEERTKRHFDLTVEAIRHDLLGANRDAIEVLQDRVTRLERHAGLAPA